MNLMLDKLLQDIRACELCTAHLPFHPRPVLRASQTARLCIVGQAPSTRVHNTGLPWNDASGDRLRQWLQMDKSVFYDEKRIAITPTAFCYPGKGKNGDLPPRPECAPQWHPALREQLVNVRLTLLVGQYAQRYYLAERAKRNLTLTVQAWREYMPTFLPLPHPSPRNQFWLKNNPWFTEEVIPILRQTVQSLWEEG